jgi:hypothetical protein
VRALKLIIYTVEATSISTVNLTSKSFKINHIVTVANKQSLESCILRYKNDKLLKKPHKDCGLKAKLEIHKYTRKGNVVS